MGKVLAVVIPKAKFNAILDILRIDSIKEK